MRSLVIGASGLVGSALLRALGADATGTYRSRAVDGLRPLDARDAAGVRELVRELEPAVVFFPAAEPNVDWCELHPEAAREANVLPALGALAAAREIGVSFVFFSTDYVFDGREGPYDERADARPLSVYGRQKREVEQLVLDAGCTVVRTTTVYGSELPPGKNFVLRLVSRLLAGEPATIPSDQFATPTWSADLARASVAVARDPGIWNAAGPDLMARDEFARLVARTFWCDLSLIRPVSTATLAQPARRPLRAGLRTEKIARAKGIAFTPTAEALRRLADEVASE